MGIIQKLFGTHSEHELKRIYPIVDKIEALRPSMQALTDEQLRAKTDKIESLEPDFEKLSDEELRDKTREFKSRLAGGETLDDILPEAFATVREAAKRAIGMEHYRVQLIGGIILHQGRIAEMRTGEGKTLVSTLPAYLNALEGKGVHVITVNDYLASRDAEWMGQVHRFLGLTVGVVLNDMKPEERREAYRCDITYVTNNELGFDYLRDNMAVYKENLVLRDLRYAIIDEVDSVLIDEARTPLIISGQGNSSTKLYEVCDILARQLEKGTSNNDDISKMDIIMGAGFEETGDFVVSEKDKTVNLTEQGTRKVEKFFHLENLADPANLEIQHNVILALRAHYLMFRDKDYVVDNNEVLIVDEFTGRIMPGRRFSDGLHQAIEAKERVKVEAATQTFATITLQNYFRMYHKLSGMTGTAETEAGEFWDIYKLDVVVIPTNRPIARNDMNDRIYKTKREKYNAVIEEIVRLTEAGRPVLVGTTSVEISELLSRMLTMRKIKHNVLNAKLHQKEAEIVATAGQSSTVTIATNMAGRGTDIKLSQEVKAAGGLAIIGTERHESRRVDRQLRGRAGRQGDPGSSVFFVSLEDDLMRLFASEKIAGLMDKLGFKEGEVLEHSMLSKSVERAQKKVEENNFGIRKRLLEYDDVMNSQRNVIYTRRRHALMGERIGLDVLNTIYDTSVAIVDQHADGDYEGFKLELFKTFAMECPFTEEEFKNGKADKLADKLFDEALQLFKRRMERMTQVANPVIKQVYEHQGAMYENIMIPITDGKRMYNVSCNLKEAYETESKAITKAFQKSIVLHTIDEAWKEHLREMDELRHSVQNASYENKDPLLIYKLESYNLFKNMVDMMNRKTAAVLMRGQIPVREEPTEEEKQAMAARQAAMEEAARQRIAIQRAEAERHQDMSKYRTEKTDISGNNNPEERAQQQPRQEPVRAEKRVGRNDPCPCGSGKKYKNCCGR